MTLPQNNNAILSTSPKSSNQFSLYAESSSTRRTSVPSVHDSPSLQKRLIDAQTIERNFVPPRM